MRAETDQPNGFFCIADLVDIVPVEDETGAVLFDLVQRGVADPIAFTDWCPDRASAEARLLLVAKALMSHFIEAGNEPFLDHLISILPPPEPKSLGDSRAPAEAGECSAAGVDPAGEGSLPGREEPVGSKRSGGAFADVPGGLGTVSA